MVQLFRLTGAVRSDPHVAAWFAADEGGRRTVRPWFDCMQACGDDVLQLIHDGAPTVCVADAAFGYVDCFRAHANVGFFYGAMLDDPAGLLEGSGKRMRHVKLHHGRPIDETALRALIAAAYRDVSARLDEAAQLPEWINKEGA